MAWRLAKSLEMMRSQANGHFPGRDKSSDGTIGDAAHQSSNSDHNPWVQDAGMGVVTALDLTHDCGDGMDTWNIAEYLRTQRDPRIKYIISNKRIFSSTSSPWIWRPYTGSNPHSAHMHVSVNSTKAHYDSTTPWKFVPEDWRPTLRKNDKGPFVVDLQKLLSLTPADGNFGSGTDSRVRQYQTTHGLTVDGIVGPATWGALETEPGLPGEPLPPETVEPSPDPDLPSNRPVLRRGSKGGEVETVQSLLLIVPRDGDYGALTEAVIKGFQRGAGITADGICGVETWEKLDDLEQLPVAQWLENITCTVFGGKSDPNKSAYEDRWITDTELGCALPYRFEGERQQVRILNRATGKECITEIVDVGPWNTNDPYWETGSRPQAESGTDMSGRKTNLAGIDVTPGAAKALGLSGKGQVDWAFVSNFDAGVS
jgi:peptidoglycan hydrolase-like protein with peptidoglycan-binding domain